MLEARHSNLKPSIDFLAMQSPLLIIGAAYTGKSRFAHEALARDLPATVIGTGAVEDENFTKRIQILKESRSTFWKTIEPKDNVVQVVSEVLSHPGQLLFDSVNQWLANLTLEASRLYSGSQLEEHILFEGRQFCQEIKKGAESSRIVLVSSEVGAGLSPPTNLPRIYRQATSRINCYLAEVCSSVVLISAGIPLILKGS